MKNDSILKLGLTLMLICLVAGGALAITYQQTKDRIYEQSQAQQLNALKIVLPRAVEFSDCKSGLEIDYYEGLDKGGEVVGYAFVAEAKGYSSMIKVVVGLDLEGTLTGIEITEQKETPGLGSEVVGIPVNNTFWQAITGRGETGESGRPWFEDQFVGKMLEDLRVVIGETDTEIQSLTGATVTSEAVTKAVRESMEKFIKQNK